MREEIKKLTIFRTKIYDNVYNVQFKLFMTMLDTKVINTVVHQDYTLVTSIKNYLITKLIEVQLKRDRGVNSTKAAAIFYIRNHQTCLLITELFHSKKRYFIL